MPGINVLIETMFSSCDLNMVTTSESDPGFMNISSVFKK